MRARPFLRYLIQAALGLALGLSLQAQDRFLDAPRPAGDGVRLVVFDPTPYNIRCLAALRSQRILDVAGLTVIGVYHARQKANFQESRRVVQEGGLAWFQFHEVTAGIGPSDLFKTNACTPEFEAIQQKSDGVIFFGGPDIPSSVFGQKTHLLVEIEDPFRHYLELSAMFHLLGGAQDPGRKALLESRPTFPVLAICLGFQSLNVATGGTLIQDIPSELYRKSYVEDVIALGPERWHNNPYRRLYPLDKLMAYNFHTIQTNGRGRLLAQLGLGRKDHPRVLSSHHQALGRLGKGWIATATSRDGKVVEAIEHKSFPNVLGVQFHPENYLLWDTEPRFRQQPGDPPTSYHAILAGTPGSLEFAQSIWSWFGGRLQASYAP